MKKLSAIISSLIIVTFVGLVMAQSSKKFVLDEIDFPIVSQATSETGKPIYYRGEDSKQHKGNYHPTLYIHSLSLFISIFGYSENTVRYFGLVNTLITASIIISSFFILKFKNTSYIVPIFLALYLFHPYTIANTTLPDIDSNLLPSTMLLPLLHIVNLIKKNQKLFTKTNTIVISSLLAINFWTKLTTPLIIIPSIFFLLIISGKKIKESILQTVTITALSIAMFTISFKVYCIVQNLSFKYTIQFLVHSFTKGTGSDHLFQKIFNNLLLGDNLVIWLTLPTIIIFLISIIHTLLTKPTQTSKIVLLLGCISLLNTVIYTCLISPFGGFFKYPFPTFSLAFVPITYFLSNQKISLPKIFLGIVVTITSFMISHTFLGDNVFLRKDISSIWQYTFPTVIILSILITKFFPYIAKAMFMITLCVSLGYSFEVSRVQAIATYPTKYHYGLEGFEETVIFLKERTGDDDIIWSMKDIGYYVNNKYIENYSYFFRPNKEQLLTEKIKESKVKYFVVSTGIGQDRIDAYTNIKEVLEENLNHKVTFGNYTIYFNQQ